MGSVKYFERRVTEIKNNLIYFFKRAHKKQFQKEYIDAYVCFIKKQNDYRRLRRIDHEYIRGLETGLTVAYALSRNDTQIRYLCRDGAFRLCEETDKCDSTTVVRTGDDTGALVYLFTYPQPTYECTSLYNVFFLPEKTKEVLKSLNLNVVTQYVTEKIVSQPSIVCNYCITAPIGPGVVIVNSVIPYPELPTTC